PVFDTEGSWGTPLGLKDADIEASFTARHYLIHIGKGVNRLYWFAWDIEGTGDFYDLKTHGLTDAGTAYQQVYDWTIGNPPSGACSSKGTVWTCSFTGSNSYQAMAVWDTSQTCVAGNCSTTQFAVSSTYIEYRDLNGSVFPITKTTVPIGLKPIWLESSATH